MIIGTILSILAIAELFLGLWFITRYKNNQTTLWYGLFMIGVAMYVGANGIGYLGNIITQQQAEHLAWTGGALTAIFILPFSYTFPLPRLSLKQLLPWVIWPLLIFVPGILWTNAFILQTGTVNFGNSYTTNTGSYFYVFLGFFVAYWLWSLFNFFRNYRLSDGLHRKNIEIFMIGTIASLLISAYFDIIRPITTTTQFGYVGSLFSAVWFGCTAYIVLKK